LALGKYTNLNKGTEMKTRSKVAGAAAAAGLLALAVNGTLALWSDNASGDDILANTGHLNVSMADAFVYDASPMADPILGVTGDADHVIQSVDHNAGLDGIDGNADDEFFWFMDRSSDPVEQTAIADWFLVPEDVVLVVAPVDVELLGQNIAAKLTVDNGVGSADVTLTHDTGTYTFHVDGYGVVLGDDADEALAAYQSLTLESLPKTWLFTEGDVTPAWVVYRLTFNDVDTNGITAGDGMDLTAQPVLDAVSVVLEQVRS
jgi:hypothetical protein